MSFWWHMAEPTLHIGNILGVAWRGIQRQLERDLHAAGFGDVRSAHGAVFQTIRAEGSRITDMAEEAQVTRQAMGQLVDDLEALGYVTRIADESDGRAKLVMLTDDGWRAIDAARRSLADMEQSWAELYGAERVEGMRSILKSINGWFATVAGEA
jgi:DNA-binding MarR family transcriptional regulator